jgi:large subunit ribosomal protein L25
MDKLVLELERRSITGKKVNALRRQGIMPATLYGKGVEPVSVQIDAKEFGLLYRKAGRASLVELKLAGVKTQSAFIHAVQRHPVSRQILHADLRVVDLNQPIAVDVPLRMVGENALVEKGQAMLNLQHATLHVLALPATIPSHIDIDISQFEDFDKVVHVGDLDIPEGVTVLSPGPEEPLLSLGQAGVQEEPEAAEETATEPELVRDEREDEDDSES